MAFKQWLRIHMTTDGAAQLFNKATLIYTHHVESHPALGSEEKVGQL